MNDRRLGSIQFSTTLLPVGLWAGLWLGIGGGNAKDILNPANQLDFFNGIRSILPFIAAGIALAVCIGRWYSQHPPLMLYWGPLGLMATYGIIGAIATLLSPDGSTSIYWAAAYLSVPLVLWSVVWSADPLSQLHRLINFTWVALIFATGVLFAIALGYMDMWDVIRNPSGFFHCDTAGHWFTETSGLLRSTGVGRYAALAVIVAFVGLFRKRFYWLWAPIIVLSLMLLMTTGARTAMLGLVASIGLVVLVYGGKRAVLAGVIVLAIVIPLNILMDFGQDSLDRCFLHKGVATITEEVEVTEPIKLDSNLAQSHLEDSPSSRIQIDVQPSPKSTPLGDPSTDTPDYRTKTPVTASTPDKQAYLDSTRQPDQSIDPQPTREANSTSNDMPTYADATPGYNPSFQTQEIVADTPIADNSLAAKVPSVDTSSSNPTPTDREPAKGTTTYNSNVTVHSKSDPIPKIATTADLTPTVRSYTATMTVENNFVNLSGRTRVWEASVKIINDSPIIGRGFNADRLMLNTHVHNAYLHALLQSGVLGTIPFVAAILLAWTLLAKSLKNMARLPSVHQRIVIQMAALLAFLSVRSIPESSGAFFGVDWLLLALVFIYLQAASHHLKQTEKPI